VTLIGPVPKWHEGARPLGNELKKLLSPFAPGTLKSLLLRPWLQSYPQEHASAASGGLSSRRGAVTHPGVIFLCSFLSQTELALRERDAAAASVLCPLLPVSPLLLHPDPQGDAGHTNGVLLCSDKPARNLLASESSQPSLSIFAGWGLRDGDQEGSRQSCQNLNKPLKPPPMQDMQHGKEKAVYMH